MAKTPPAGMDLKTKGRTSKTSPGPAETSETSILEKAYMAGITIKLLNMAMEVSANATCDDVLSIWLSLLIYEP